MRAGFERLYAFLTDPITTLYTLADRELSRIEQSRSALLFLLGEAIQKKDTREQHRLEKLLQDDTNRSLAASLRQQRPKNKSSSARSCRAATPKSAATKGGAR